MIKTLEKISNGVQFLRVSARRFKPELQQPLQWMEVEG